MNLKTREEYEKSGHYYTKIDCPFCSLLNKDRIIFENKHWFVMLNEFPYYNDKNCLMAIPKRHIEFTSDLQKDELVFFVEIEKFMKDYYKDKGEYFSFIRQSKSNKSVEHMHYHYLTGTPSTKKINNKRYIEVKI